MTTAAESIAFNIVEGCGAATQKELARFLDIAIKSAYELEYQLELACAYEVLSVTEQVKLGKETVEIRKMTYAFRGKVLGAK
jgi:four helix bundle protein